MNKLEIKKILIPIDFSECSEVATSKAITLAKLLSAEIFLIHVIEFNGYNFSVIPETQMMAPSLLEIEKNVEKKTTEIRDKIKTQYGITPEVFVTTGLIHLEIISLSQKKNIDLIVMGTHGVSGFKEFFIGSNAFRVVTLSEIPVLTMQNDKNNPGFKNILIPIDNSIHSREKINMAMIFADLFKAKLHIIGLPDSDEKTEFDKFNIKLESIEKIIKTDKLPYVTSMVHGKNLAEAAINYGSENHCDLIVINTGHESEMTGIFLGAFAQQIVNHSKITVLSIKHMQGHLSIETPGFGI